MFDVGGGELIVVLLVILLLFGPKKIPEFAQMVGKGLRKFRMAQEELTQQIRDISAEAAIHEDQIGRGSQPPTVDVTQPIVAKPVSDSIPRSTATNDDKMASDDIKTKDDNLASDDRMTGDDRTNNQSPTDSREGSPS